LKFQIILQNCKIFIKFVPPSIHMDHNHPIECYVGDFGRWFKNTRADYTINELTLNNLGHWFKIEQLRSITACSPHELYWRFFSSISPSPTINFPFSPSTEEISPSQWVAWFHLHPTVKWKKLIIIPNHPWKGFSTLWTLLFYNLHIYTIHFLFISARVLQIVSLYLIHQNLRRVLQKSG
jgi:hypothetical protein